jgi:hypothetical protein
MSEFGGYLYPVRNVIDGPGGEELKMSDMALRDYFAASALQGILARGTPAGTIAASRSTLAAAAFEYADEMLKARER